MAWIGVAEGATIGTDPATVLKLAGSRKAEILPRFIFEVPKHTPQLSSYFMDLYEVSNAQYAVFLETWKTVYRTGTSSLSNLQQIASEFVYGNAESETGKKDEISWKQVLELNRQALEAALPDLKGKVQEFRLAALPPDVALTVYRARVPDNWPKGVPPEGEENHPVRYVSYLDAAKFAEWAGKHVPTEAEWEYAGRGPDGRVYPWGNDWEDTIFKDGEKRTEKRCLWGESGVRNAAMEPTTVAADSMPEGRSPFGLHHMIGNVAEWTSSMFMPYPGGESVISSDNPYRNLTGDAGDIVRVIRGGSLGDVERLVLRLSARNFEGNGHDGRPFEANRFKFVGFRCAYYTTPGLDRVDSVVARMARRKKVRPEELNPAAFRGARTTHFVPPGAEVKNGVFVTGRSYTILFVPKASLYKEDEKAVKAPTEIAAKETAEDPRILGVFHTDVALDKMKVYAPSAKKDDDKKGKPPARRHGAKQPASPEPPTKDGTVEAGSYVLGFHHGKLGLFQNNLDFVAFFAKPPVVQTRNLKKLQDSKLEAPPPSALEIEPDIDAAICSFWIRLGGKSTEDAEGVTIQWTAEFPKGELEKAQAGGQSWGR
jgi:formylglycine-generating enzyme required for sulfatase activity